MIRLLLPALLQPLSVVWLAGGASSISILVLLLELIRISLERLPELEVPL